MPHAEPRYVDTLNDRYFGGRLAAAVLDRLAELPMDRQDARSFAERMFRFMAASDYPAQDLSVFQADMLGSLLARLLPGRWGGRVPPITVAGRHRRIDQLVAARFPGPGRFIDIACGFPPVTTVDTSAALPGWTVLGVDRALPAFLVHDGQGNYCVYDERGEAQYFQPLAPTPAAWNALLADWHATKERFEQLLAELHAHHLAGSTAPSAAALGARVTVDPARQFEHGLLRFQRCDLAELGDIHAEPADVVRCFNMLLYFDDAFRTASLEQVAGLLREGGWFVTGTDWAATTECRYFTYRKVDGRLVPDEFAFSLDNVAAFTIVPWYTLHDDCRELATMVPLARCLRADERFHTALRRRADALREEYGLCPRRPDGFYGEVDSSQDPGTLWAGVVDLSDRLEAELAGEAAAALARAGHAARVNEVGHVAVALA